MILLLMSKYHSFGLEIFCVAVSWNQQAMGTNCRNISRPQAQEQECGGITAECAKAEGVQIQTDPLPAKEQPAQGRRC